VSGKSFIRAREQLEGVVVLESALRHQVEEARFRLAGAVGEIRLSASRACAYFFWK
jgi:hypothetical protein